MCVHVENFISSIPDPHTGSWFFFVTETPGRSFYETYDSYCF
jgi:hypothetical protein